MKKQLITFAIVAMGASSAVWAQSTTYTIDSSHTFPSFTYNHMGFSDQTSRFNNTTGTVTFDPKAQEASVEIVIDTTTVDTGFKPFDGHIQGADFLDTAQFPTATFKSTRVIFENNKPHQIEGNLTIKGITLPVTLDVTSFNQQPHPMLKVDAIGANAHTMIKRSDFNADKFVPAVSDDIRIDVSIEALAQ